MRGRGGCKLDFRLILARNWGHYMGRGSSENAHKLKNHRKRSQSKERVPAAYSLFAGTVPSFNLFHKNILEVWKIIKYSSRMEYEEKNSRRMENHKIFVKDGKYKKVP